MAYRTLRSKYDGECGRCKGQIKVGQTIIWNPRTRYTAHRWCETPDRLMHRDAIRADMQRNSMAFWNQMHPHKTEEERSAHAMEQEVLYNDIEEL